MHDAARLVRNSHERYDGHGYPDRLNADEIPLGARIIAVADGYDVMTTPRPAPPRPGTPAAPVAAALAEVQRHAGSRFDPRVIAALERALTPQAPAARPADAGARR